MNNFLGIDWGGTYIKAGIINQEGKILEKVSFSSNDFTHKQSFVEKIACLVTTFKSYKIQGVGVGAPGIVDIKKGFIYYLPNVSGWKNYPLKDVLQKKIKLPVAIDNDANVFALAEARLGSACGAKHVIFLTLGTGLGGAIISEGRLLEARTSALELGHVPIALAGKKCSCGGTGCIETFTGSKHLLNRYAQLKKSVKATNEVKEIYHNALRGEKEALIVWKEFSIALGKFLSGMINIFNPEVIVLGGGVAGAFGLFKPFVWQAIRQQAMWPQIKNLKLVRARLQHAGIIGAGLLVKESLYKEKQV